MSNNKNSIQVDNKWIGIPFEWQGKGFNGTDCAQLTHMFLTENGIKVKVPDTDGKEYGEDWQNDPQRFVSILNKGGKKIPPDISKLQPYDVLCFKFTGKVRHIGIYLGYGKFLHILKDRRSCIERLEGPWKKFFIGAIRPTEEASKDDIPFDWDEGKVGDPITAVVTLITASVMAAAGGFTATAVFVATAFIALTAAAYFLAPKPAKPNFGMSDFSDIGMTSGSTRYGSFGALQSTASSDLSLGVLYGELKISTNAIYQSDPAEEVNRCDVLCVGEVDTISEIKVNDTAIADLDGCSVTSYTGTVSQTVDSRFSARVPGLRNVAYLALTLKASDKLQGGFPTVTAVVKGQKIQTWDGTQWTTAKTWSQNPAACIRDLLLNTRYGVGVKSDLLDESSFGEVYDYCAALVDDNNGGTEARYTLNVMIDSRRPAIDVLSDLLGTFGGYLVWSGNRLRLKVEKTDSYVQDFTMSDIVEKSFSYRYIAKDDAVNRVKVQFIDPTQNYTKVFAVAEDKSAQDEREAIEGCEGVIEKEVSLLGITRFSQASRIANQMLRSVKAAPIGCSFRVGIKAIHCEPGDIITVSHDVPSWTNKPFRIVSVQEHENDEMSLVCKEYNSSVYNDSYGTGVSSYQYGSPTNPNQPLPDVTNVVIVETNYVNGDGTYISDIDVTWTGITSGLEYFDTYIIELKRGGEGYQEVGRTRDESITIPNVQVGLVHYVRVKVKSTEGLVTSGAVSNALTIQGKAGVPNNVSNFAASFTDEIKFSWSNNGDADLWGYEIRTTNSNWASGDTTGFIWRGSPNNYTLIRPGSRAPGTYYIRALDTSGNYSATSASVTPTNTAPSAPVVVPVVWFGFAELQWTDSSDDDLRYYEVHKSNTSGGNYYLEKRVSGTKAEVQGDPPFIGSGDTFGNEVSNGYCWVKDTKLVGSGDARWLGNTIAITRGTGSGQNRTIVGVDNTQGRVSGDTTWTTIPAATSEWAITDTRYYKICGVDSYGSGDFSNVAVVNFEQISEDMLGDQVITARKIYAGEVITLSAQIKDAIITNAKISDLNANKITAGTLQAGTITVNASGDIRSSNYSSGDSGFKLDGVNGLEVWSGSIIGTVLNRDSVPYVSADSDFQNRMISSRFLKFAGDGSQGELIVSGDTNFSDVDDTLRAGWAQFTNLTITSGDTLTIDTGFAFIGVTGVLTIHGTISAVGKGHTGATGGGGTGVTGKMGRRADGTGALTIRDRGVTTTTEQLADFLPDTTRGEIQWPILDCVCGAGGGGGGSDADGGGLGGAGGGGGGWGGYGGPGHDPAVGPGVAGTATSTAKKVKLTGCSGDNTYHMRFFNPDILKYMGASGGQGGDGEGAGPQYSQGGSGGGTVYIECEELVFDGRVDSSGAPGTLQYNSGGGGGGGGGIAIIRAKTITTNTGIIVASGGGGGAGGVNGGVGGPGAFGFIDICPV